MVSSDHGDTPETSEIAPAVSDASVPKLEKAGDGEAEAGNLGLAYDPWGELHCLPAPSQNQLEHALAQARFLVELLAEKRYPVALAMARAHVHVLENALRSPIGTKAGDIAADHA